jgi:hypothetical protein
MSKLYSSVSGLSILMALALALGEWYFFFYGETWDGPALGAASELQHSDRQLETLVQLIAVTHPSGALRRANDAT